MMIEQEKERDIMRFMDFARARIPANIELRPRTSWRMSWSIALLVSLLSGLVTAAFTAPVADHVTRRMKVSDREGARGMAVVFLFVPAGLIGGVLLGLLGSKLVHLLEWSGFWRALGVSLMMSIAALFTIAGFCLLSIPRPPLLHGHPLDLEAEVYIPSTLHPLENWKKEDLRASLYAGKDDNHYIDVDHSRAIHASNGLTVHLRTRLNTISPGRMLTITVKDTTSYTLDMPLGPLPKADDLTWTQQLPMRLSRITGNGYTYTQVMVRYRVVKAEKESPVR